MSFSEFFTDDELCNQLREQFDENEQYDMDFLTIFNLIVDREIDYYLEFRGRKFSIDKLTGFVTEVGDVEEDDEDEQFFNRGRY